MVDATIFIPLMIVAITQLIKMAAPKIAGWATVIIAMLVGIVVALIAEPIGVAHVSIAQGLIYALEAIGISVVAGKAGGGVKGD
jgi:hypothetical protein